MLFKNILRIEISSCPCSSPEYKQAYMCIYLKGIREKKKVAVVEGGGQQ